MLCTVTSVHVYRPCNATSLHIHRLCTISSMHCYKYTCMQAIHCYQCSYTQVVHWCQYRRMQAVHWHRYTHRQAVHYRQCTCIQAVDLLNDKTRVLDLFWKYLEAISDSRYRIATSKLRATSHTLEIERGWYTKPKNDISKRLCPVCYTIEDEVHFLINCKLYEPERQRIFLMISDKKQNFQSLNDVEKIYFSTVEPGQSTYSLDR